MKFCIGYELMNRIDGDWGACAEVFKWVFIMQFIGAVFVPFVAGIVVGVIECIAKLAKATYSLAVLAGASIGGLILGGVLGTIAAAGCSGLICGTASLQDAFNYAEFWAKQGEGLSSILTKSNDYPQIYDPNNLADNMYL